MEYAAKLRGARTVVRLGCRSGAAGPQEPNQPNQSVSFFLHSSCPNVCGGDDMAAAGDLSDEERRALRGSKFAPLPSRPPSSRPNPRMAHPGGPLTTNKAAALARFLERKLQQPDGLDSLNPDLVTLAVKNAKETIKASKGEPSTSGRVVRHVSSFDDCSEDSEDSKDKAEVNGIKRKRKNKPQKPEAYEDDLGQSKKKKKKKKKKNINKKCKGC